MKVIHLSAECYPVAKVGGLGDVVGALPKYLNLAGTEAAVVMPFYDRKFTRENELVVVYEASSFLGYRPFNFQVLKEKKPANGFDLFLIKIPGLLDREEVYGYPDDTERFTTFQIAFLDWISLAEIKPDIIHCHDHHTGLVPFLLYNSARYQMLADIPTICTIHNGQYQGAFGWDRLYYLPEIDNWKTGLLDWNGLINPLAAAVKCSWKYTTVSPSYLEELLVHSNGLELLFQSEYSKGVGIINGIDSELWNAVTDPMLKTNYTAQNVEEGKRVNKAFLCKEFNLSAEKPLFAFIGRLVGEKGADLLAETISRYLIDFDQEVSFLILGSGEPDVEVALSGLKDRFPGQYNAFIGYNEELSHQIYAGADFLMMPSRVEPCGLNQLYAMRYGTLPIVRNTGGLRDTVIDFSKPNGYGIRFDDVNVEQICYALHRAAALFRNDKKMKSLRERMMALDFSWDRSAKDYIELYLSLKR